MLAKNYTKAALIALAVIFGSAGAVHAIHSWGLYHWARTANPFTLKVVDSVTVSLDKKGNIIADWDPYLDEAISDWAQSSVLDLTKEAGATGKTDRLRCNQISGKVRACNYTYGNTGWLGVAQIWVDPANHITQGTTKVNDTYFNTSTYNIPAWRRLVMCQEIGHDFGLDHQDEDFSNPNLGTCMDYTSDPDGPPSNEHPNQHDYGQLETIYGHLDSSTTIKNKFGRAPFGRGLLRAALSEKFAEHEEVDREDLREEMKEVGEALRQDFGGRRSHFVREDRETGEKVFTFIIWADEGATN